MPIPSNVFVNFPNDARGSVASRVHGALARERLRADREFFRIDFFEAERQIAALEHDLEMRTLARPAALAAEGLSL